jgi:hypothetical protein
VRSARWHHCAVRSGRLGRERLPTAGPPVDISHCRN